MYVSLSTDNGKRTDVDIPNLPTLVLSAVRDFGGSVKLSVEDPERCPVQNSKAIYVTLYGPDKNSGQDDQGTEAYESFLRSMKTVEGFCAGSMLAGYGPYFVAFDADSSDLKALCDWCDEQEALNPSVTFLEEWE